MELVHIPLDGSAYNTFIPEPYVKQAIKHVPAVKDFWFLSVLSFYYTISSIYCFIYKFI